MSDKEPIEFFTAADIRSPIGRRLCRLERNPFEAAFPDVRETADCFYPHIYADGTPYEIEKSRLETAGHALEWIYHLMGKTWMTPERLFTFLRLIEDHCRAMREDC